MGYLSFTISTCGDVSEIQQQLVLVIITMGIFQTFIFMGYFTHILGVFQTFIFPWVFGGPRVLEEDNKTHNLYKFHFLLKTKNPKNPGMSQERDYPYIPIRSGGVWILRETYPVAFRRGFGACVHFAVATEKYNTPRALRAGGTNSKFRTGGWFHQWLLKWFP